MTTPQRPVLSTQAQVGPVAAGNPSANMSGGVSVDAPISPPMSPPMSPFPPEYLDRENATVGRERNIWHLPGPFRRLRVGLRARAAIALALGALLIAIAVAVLTYVVARSALVDERKSAVQKRAFASALEIQNNWAPSQIKTSVIEQSGDGFTAIVIRPDAKLSYAGSVTISERDIPTSMRERLSEPTAGAVSQVVRRSGTTALIVGIPLRELGAEFYGVADMREVENRLKNLGRTLSVATLLTALLSGLLGRAISRRLLRPLGDVADAASGISSGRLDTRLELSGDADLDPLLRSFNDMASSLQSRIEREARFASDVSHELRTPLTALVTAARLLDGRRDELSERSQKTLDVLVTQTVHFERLVLDLLEMSRFDAGAATLHGEIVSLPDLLRQVVASNESDAVVIVEDLDPVEVGIDKRRVERIVANLLQNASNYASGATSVRVSQTAAAPERRIRIAVDDSGPGVPEDERDAIFERFRRGQSHLRGTSSQKGTGLGLSLVRAHANLHGGTVWVEDSPAGGARFVVDIAEVEVTE